jgi:hypothetical protein
MHRQHLKYPLILGFYLAASCVISYVAFFRNLTATERSQQPADANATISGNSSKRILVVVSDYKPPSSRLEDLLRQYQRDFHALQQLHPQVQFDFYFVCSQNFLKNLTLGCVEAARDEKNRHGHEEGGINKFVNPFIPYLVLDPSVALPILDKCTYCQRNNPWGYSAYMAPLLALRQLEAQRSRDQLPYAAVWSLDPDLEFVGNNVAEWLANYEASWNSAAAAIPPLVSSLVLPSIEKAEEVLEVDMYARVHTNWGRWKEVKRGTIDFGVFTYITRFSRDMMLAVEQHLTAHSGFVETFLPFVCQREFPATCRAASLPYESVGYFNNGGYVFAGEKSVTNFRAISNMIRARNVSKWYHPVKFPESWRGMPAPFNYGNHSSMLFSGNCSYNGKHASMSCYKPCKAGAVIDDCLFVKE